MGSIFKIWKIWKKGVKNGFFWISQEQTMGHPSIPDILCIMLVQLYWYLLWVFYEDVCEVSK